MDKKKIFLGIELLVDILAIVAIIVLAIVLKLDINFYYSSLGIIMGLGLFNLITIMIEEMVIKEYQAQRFTIAMHAFYTVLNVGAYYLVKYVGGYEVYNYLYLILSFVGTILIVVMFMIFNYHSKKDNNDNKPKFRVNNNRK